METKIESKVGQIKQLDETVFKFLSNFDNIKVMIPPDKLDTFESNGDTCSFKVKGFKIGMKIIEKEASKLIKISEDGKNPFTFNMWIQLKQVDAYDTRIKITIKAELNMMMKAMAKKPLKQFVDGLVDGLSQFHYQY